MTTMEEGIRDQHRGVTPKDTEASTEPVSNCHKAPVVVRGGDTDGMMGGTRYYECTYCEAACDLFADAKEAELETQTQGEQGTSPQASSPKSTSVTPLETKSSTSDRDTNVSHKPVAPERELRAKLLKAAQDNFDEGDYITDSQDWRRFFDAILTEVTHTIEEAVVAELKRVRIESEVTILGAEYLERRIKELEGLQETK